MLCSTIPSEILLQKSQTCYQPCEQRTCIENCCSSLSYSRSQIFKSLSAEALDSVEVGRSSSHCTVSKLLTHRLHERNIMVIVLHCPVLWCLRAFVLSLLQSCLTLCDPMGYSLPGSSVHGDSPGKNTGVGSHALL